MNINATALRMPQVALKAPAAKPQAAPQEVSTFSNDGVSWGDAAVGLVAGAAGGAITGVGAGLTSIKHSLLGTAEAYKALWTNETIGPVLKTAMGTLLPIATVGVPVLSAIGGAAVGIYRGFVEGATNGLSAALAQSTKDVHEFNTELAPEARKGIREFGEAKLQDGEKPFDVSPIRGAEAVAAGLGNTVVGAVGIGASTISQIPEAFWVGNKAIAQSDMGLPLRTVSHVVSVPLAVAAAPLSVVGGALFGLGSGAYHGYNDGFVSSFKQTGEHIADYHKYVDDGLAKLAEGLVDHDH